MYEILGVNVVDTFPQSIAAEFRRAHVDPNRGEILPWYELFESVRDFDPETAFHDRGKLAAGTVDQAETQAPVAKPLKPSRTPQKGRRR